MGKQVKADIGVKPVAEAGRQVQLSSERTSEAETESDAGLMDHVVDALMDVIWQCLQHEGNDNRSCLEIMKRVRDMMPEHKDMVAQLSEAWKTDNVEEFEFFKDSMAMYFVNEAKDQRS